MEIRNFQARTQWTPNLPSHLRSLTAPAVPQAPPVEPTEPVSAQALQPQAALKTWLQQYTNLREGGLFDRVSADPSGEATLFRRGLMISGVVSVPSWGE